MKNVFVPDAVNLAFHLGKHFPAHVQSVQLKLNRQSRLRPAASVSPFPNLRPNDVFGAVYNN